MTEPEILLVEDEPSSSEALSFWLRLNGFRVTLAGNGEEALKRIDERLPAVVLTDVMMPMMDGLTLLRQIRSRSDLDGVPVVLMSAAHTVLEQDLPVAAALRKPLDLHLLLSTVCKITGFQAKR